MLQPLFSLQAQSARRWSARGGTVGTAAGVAWWEGSTGASVPAATRVLGVRGGDAAGGGSLSKLRTNKFASEHSRFIQGERKHGPTMRGTVMEPGYY